MPLRAARRQGQFSYQLTNQRKTSHAVPDRPAHRLQFRIVTVVQLLALALSVAVAQIDTPGVAATGWTNPVASTVALVASAVDQVTDLPLPGFPSVVSTVAVSCTPPPEPLVVVGLVGDICILPVMLPSTVSVRCPVCPPDEMPIELVPAARAVMRPKLSMVATLVLELEYVMGRGTTLPVRSSGSAFSCT